MQEKPVRFCTKGNVAELEDLIEGKRKCEESRREEVEGQVESRHGKEKDVRKQDKDMMEWYNTLPAKPCEKCDTLILLVLCEGLEVEHNEIGKGEKSKRNGERKERMRLVGLQREGK